MVAPDATVVGASPARGSLDTNHATGETCEKKRREPWIPKSLFGRVRWALATAIATLAITFWCLLPQTRALLPFAAYGAFVTVFLAERTLGKILKVSADCIVGATYAAVLAWPLGLLHGENWILAALALFAQCFLWAYLELPLPAKRIALSCAVMLCLTAQRKPLSIHLVVGLLGVVALSGACALLGLLLLPNAMFGPRRASVRAASTAGKAGRLGCLLLERIVCTFLEKDVRRQHIAEVQLAELTRSASQIVLQLEAELDDSKWEPCRSIGAAKQDLCVYKRLLDHCDSLKRTLKDLPFNTCHGAFAERLQGPLASVVSSVSDLILRPVDSVDETVAAMSKLHIAYGQARRELLYPERSEIGDLEEKKPALAKKQLATMDICQTTWQTEDLLHMNTFLFTMMHLAADMLHLRNQRPSVESLSSVWMKYFSSMLKLLRPSLTCRLSLDRIAAATRFASAITLTAAFCFAQPLSSRFKLEIWAPVEVTFLMFKHSGGSLRQTILRLEGTVLGAVVGYLLVLFYSDSIVILAFSLALWSFVACLFRGHVKYAYAAIVAAWTAVIIVAEGVASKEPTAVTPALERIIHAVIAGAAVVSVVNLMFPKWARDVAHTETAAVISGFGDLYASLQKTWMARSKQMQNEPGTDGEAESASLLNGAADGENTPGSLGGLVLSDSKEQNRRNTLLGMLGQRLTSVEALVAEASFEPSLWRPPYHAEATRRVLASLSQMLQWLRMFSTCLTDMDIEQAGAVPGSSTQEVLSQVFGLENLRRWLTREWVNSLQYTNEEITSTLTGLSRTVQECLQAGVRSRWLCKLASTDRQARAEQLYLCAMHLHGLETRLKRQLGQFLSRYDWILSGTITESQLKILAGTRTEQYLRNLDVLFYNSLVFAMRGFVRELLICSLAVRELATAEAGTANLTSPADMSVLSKKPADVEQGLSQFACHEEHPKHVEVQFSSANQPREKSGELSSENSQEAVAQQRLVLTVVGPDRPGIVYQVASAVFSQGGSVAASRMTKLDDFFAVVMQIVIPVASVTMLESELGSSLPGLQVSMRVAREQPLPQKTDHEAEVRCVCPEDAPGLLMRFTGVLVEAGLNILLLDTELRRLASGQGFIVCALVGSEVPVDAANLQLRLDELCASQKLGIAARISVAVSGERLAQTPNPQAEEEPLQIETSVAL